MSRPATTLLIDGLLGPGSVTPLAEQMAGSEVTCFAPQTPNWSVSTYRRALEDLLDSGQRWDLAVGFNWSAGIAAQLRLQGRAERAILFDPTINVSGLRDVPGLVEALKTAQSPVDDQILEQMGSSFMDIMLQPVDDQIIDQVFGVSSGDPGRIRLAAAYKEQQARWGSLHGRDPIASPDDLPAVDWPSAMEQDPAGIELWWSAPYAKAVQALQAHWPDRTFVAQPWPERSWLTADPRVAAALDASAPPHHSAPPRKG